jgi:uncharacterized protein YjiS (DUF1127 family)
MTHLLDLPRATPESDRNAGRSCRSVSRSLARAIRNRLNAWVARRAIESLRALDDRMLADIGMHRSQIEYVVRRHLARHQ